MKKNSKIIKIFAGCVLIGILVLIVVLIDLLSVGKTKADTTANVSGWAYSENVGWISFNSNDCDKDDNNISDNQNYPDCPVGLLSKPYGVNIGSDGKLSGQAWSENVGWISFNESETGIPFSADPCGSGCIALADPSGELGKSNVAIKGWARALAACDSVPCSSSGPGSNTGGWDGWIRFDYGKNNEAYIDSSYKFHGWAWGDKSVGWISFNSSDVGAGGNYSVKVSGICSCNSWINEGCATAPCSAGQMKRTRTCNPSGCDAELSCLVSSACMHKECNASDKCVDVLESGTDECTDDNSCKPTLWRWWETIPR